LFRVRVALTAEEWKRRVHMDCSCTDLG